MKNIDKKILKAMNSFEVCELTRLLEAVEMQEYYISGLKYISGGFVNTEVCDLLIGEDYDEETEEEHDIIQFWIISGVENDEGSSADNSRHSISKRILNDNSLSLREKLLKIERA